MNNKFVRKDLMDFKPYHAPSKEYQIKLDANENPFQHPESVLEIAREFLADKDSLTRYPDTDQTILREKIATAYQVSKENVTCGVGSDQLIEYIIKAFIEPGDIVLFPNPSFSMYGLSTTLNHGKWLTYELNDDFSYPIDEIIRLAIETQPKIIFICSPNNPTGSVIDKNDLIRLLEVIECPVVVDEAYSEFIEDSIVDQINQYRQLIVLRTFSKAYGLAGLRVGYGIACSELIDIINICKAPYNLSAFSQVMACAVLDYHTYYQEMVNEINLQRELLAEQLIQFEFILKVFPSQANFLLVQVKDLELAAYLEKNKVLVRPYGTSGRLDHCIRFTVGTKLENKYLVQLLESYSK